MQSARCTQNNVVYDAKQFSKLPSDEREQKRRNLVCPECGQPVCFRDETQNEGNASFGTGWHHDGCSMGATNASKGHSADLLNSTNRIVIDFDYDNITPLGKDQSDSAQNGNHTTNIAASTALNTSSVSVMRLGPLLRLLIDDPQFSASQKIVEIEGMCRPKACDLFVSAHAIDDRHERKLMGVFGKITSVEYLPEVGTLWLNFGGPNDPSIYVSRELAPILFHRLGTNRICALAQANVLIFEVIRNSLAGKWVIVMENVMNFAIEFERDQ